MEGRGSLRQLHQQLAEASYVPAPAVAVPTHEWQQGGFDRHRAAPPLPTLPPWATNPPGAAIQQTRQQHIPAPYLQQHQQPYVETPRTFGTSHSREELDPTASEASQSSAPTSGWRKAPSYFGSMKRLPRNASSNNGVDHGIQLHPQPPVRRHEHQLPGLARPLQQNNDSDDHSGIQQHESHQKKHDFAFPEPQHLASRLHALPLPSFATNQQLEATDAIERRESMQHIGAGAGATLSPPRRQQLVSACHSDIDRRPATPAIIDNNEPETDTHATNQTDDNDSDNNAVLVAPATGGFFRPWKKKEPEDVDDADNNNSNNHSNSYDRDSASSQQSNKWKERALVNPFARRSKATAVTRAPVVSSSRNAANATEQLDQRSASRPSTPSRSPLLARRPRTPVIATQSPLPSVATRLSPRPRSAVHSARSQRSLAGDDSKDDDNSVHSRRNGTPPREQRSRDASQRPVAASPPTNCYNREEREDFAAFKSLTTKPRNAAQPSSGSSARSTKPSPATLQQSIPSTPTAVAPQLSRAAKREAATAAAKAKPKGAVLSALAEIQRKRDARRAQHAEEKQRMQTELEAHGDDAGYKFRRLIQQYRAALPAFQTAIDVESETEQQESVAICTSSSNADADVDATTSRLSVFVRKRPLSKQERKAKGYDVVSCLYGSNFPRKDKRPLRNDLVLHEPKLKVDCSEALEHHAFRFDGVFDEHQTNAQLYRNTVGPLIPSLLLRTTGQQQTSLTVFAYGQTGSGKTYTMQSIYRFAAADIFRRIDDAATTASSNAAPSVRVGVSFYEIYMNNVNDLLNRRSRLQLLEDGDSTVQLLGLKEVMVASAEELLALVAHGEAARATSANAVHDDSSRSHALLRVTLYASSTSNNASTMLARLSMVDLAGSERACDTQSDSKHTRMEGAEINKSLLALKECVRALDRSASSNSSSGTGHVPFRQSKLTQLLRDSFVAARSQTVMIATVSPGSASCNHTLNTLRYADRLKEIGASTTSSTGM